MKLMKRILIHILIVLILLMACFSVYYSSKYKLPVYADSTTEEWTSVTTNGELVEAFRYYCKSRNLVIDGSALDVLTNFTTTSFNNICGFIGVDVTALQAHLKKSTDSNNRVQFLFDEFGITAYNRIFAEFLQNYDLEVGDTVENQVIEQGEFVLDAEGHGAFVYVVTDLMGGLSTSNCTAKGSVYKYTSQELYTICVNHGVGDSIYAPFKDNSGNRNLTMRYYIYNGGSYTETFMTNYVSNYSSSTGWIYHYRSDNQNSRKFYGHMGIFKYSSKYYYGIVTDTPTGVSTWYSKTSYQFWPYQNKGQQSITINATNINNNTYTDNRQTVINNEGDVNNYDYDDDDPPVNPPPSTVTPPSNSGGDDGDVTFPDFNFQLPEIDWSLGDLHDKFPFSIPFDLVEFLTVLNAEPLTPEFEGDLNLGIINHHFEFDLHQFDGLAQLLRAMEFIGFCIGLILITRQMIRV